MIKDKSSVPFKFMRLFQIFKCLNSWYTSCNHMSSSMPCLTLYHNTTCVILFSNVPNNLLVYYFTTGSFQGWVPDLCRITGLCQIAGKEHNNHYLLEYVLTTYSIIMQSPIICGYFEVTAYLFMLVTIHIRSFTAGFND